MKKVLIVIFASWMSHFSFAQKSGVFQTTTGETIEGKIYLRLEDQRVDELILKVDKKKTAYKAHKILGIYFENGDTIQTIKYNGRYQFAKVEESGPFLNYYRIADPQQERKELALALLVKQDNSQLEVGNIGFKNRVRKFLDDCPEVSDKVENGEFKKSQLNEIVKQYNDCIGSRSSMTQMMVEKQPIKEQPAISQLITKIADGDLGNKADLLEMLEDVKDKLEGGQDIPKYLKGAIIEAFGENQELISAFESALQQ